MEKTDVFDRMLERWPSEVVARTSIEKFTGDMISSKYMANLDSQGQGPEGKVTVGRKVGYPVVELVEWLRNRAN